MVFVFPIVFRFLRSIVPAIVFAFSAACALASAPLQYTRTLWRTQDGLPENIIQAIAEDKDGYLWIGTTGGLVQFDGAHFQLFRDRNGKSLPDNNIFCLLLSRDGSLWVGTEGGGLAHIYSGVMDIVSSAQGLSNGFVRTIEEDAAGRIWVGTDNGLFRVAGKHATRIDHSPFPGASAIHSIREDSLHRLWVGGDRLFDLENDKQHDGVLPGSYSQNKIKAILQTKNGELWIGTVSGLLREKGGKFQQIPEIHQTVRTLRQTSDGTLWIGTIGGGLWCYRDGSFLRVDKEGLLPSNTVLSIYQDSAKRIWIGTQNGLLRFEETPVNMIELPGGSDSDFATISGDRSDDLWMVAQSVYRIHDNVARKWLFPQLGNVAVRNLLRAHDGSLWVGTDGSGAFHLVGGKTVHYTAPAQLTNNFIRGFLETANGDIWIAADEGVSRISSGTVHQYNVAQGLAYFSTRSLCEDKNHDVWIGTEKGVSHWHAGSFVQDNATRSLQDEKVWSILQDRHGILWFGTRDHGLFRYRDGKIAQYTTTQGLISNSIYQLLQDRNGRYWITSPNSIAVANEQDLEGSFPTADRPLSIRAFPMPYDADGAQLYGGRQPSGYLAPDNSVWFPTSKGAAHVVVQQGSLGPVPKLRIVGVSRDGHDLPVGENLHLPARTSRLVFTFTPILLSAQDGIRFRYQLEGFDKGWIFSGTVNTATYTNLPAGQYRFRVEAFDQANPEMSSEVALQITKAQFFYRTWWFLSLLAIFLGVVAWLLYGLRLKRIKKGFAAVLEERTRLAREMHDTVIQGCTSVSALLEAIASLASHGAAVEAELLTQARTQIVSTIEEARRAVWNLRRDQESPVQFFDALRGISVQASRAFLVPVMAYCPDGEMKLPASIAHELLMVVREAVANAGTHAKAKEIKICGSYDGKELHVAVEDDGCGFTPSEKNGSSSGHFGLKGMEERMQKVGGSFRVSSHLEKGTRVELRLRRSRLLPASKGDQLV